MTEREIKPHEIRKWAWIRLERPGGTTVEGQVLEVRETGVMIGDLPVPLTIGVSKITLLSEPEWPYGTIAWIRKQPHAYPLVGRFANGYWNVPGVTGWPGWEKIGRAHV